VQRVAKSKACRNKYSVQKQVQYVETVQQVETSKACIGRPQLMEPSHSPAVCMAVYRNTVLPLLSLVMFTAAAASTKSTREGKVHAT